MKRKTWPAAWGMTVLLLIGAAAWAEEKSRFAELLVAAPWCSFTYNNVTGGSNAVRYRFFKDGSYVAEERAQDSLSGAAGSFTSRRDRTSGGNWQLEGNALSMTVNGAARPPAHLSIKMDSNGVPVLVTDGVEFSPCQ